MSAFANAANKLGAPPKKSVFERQKEEAEAKKTREKAETAAAYEDFVKSFEGDGDAPPQISRPTQGSLGGGHGPGKRHFTSSGLKSGPGSLGPALGPAFGKKRHFDDFSGRRERERDSHRDRDRMFGYEHTRDRQDKDIFVREEEDRKDDEDQAARPTLHLASLPPGTSPAVIKALLTSSPLVVENIRILPGSTADRKAFAAIVTLAAETPSSEIDTLVSQLQNRYLGSGFSLSISRHLSSAALIGTNAINTPGSTASTLPFGARPITQNTSLSRAPPPGQSGRFAPPSSYTSSTPYSQRPQSQVVVTPPSDLKQLKLIHKTLEAVLTYGPEFEALLMSRPPIQRDPQWSWLYTPRSQSGVYYRWRMWEIITSSNSSERHGVASYGVKPKGDFLFENQPQWIPPPAPLKFEYTTQLDDFVSDEDYNSSDEEDNDEPSLAQRHNDHNVPNSVDASTTDNDGTGYLNPLANAKMVHLLSRLPDSNAKLRKGDVARITAFAIEHAGSGAAEVADLVTLNIVRPFSLRLNRSSQDRDSHSDSDAEENATSTTRPSTNNTHIDPSPSSLIALYILSDILSASSSSGVRHAWRYRSLFHASLTTHHVFEVLGRYERKLQWGKLKAEKWRRSVMMLLSVWEGWGVWMGDVIEGFRTEFDDGAKAETEGKSGAERGDAEEDAAVPGNAVGKTGFKTAAKWKSVDDISATPNTHSVLTDKDTIDGIPMSDDDETNPTSESRSRLPSKHPSKYKHPSKSESKSKSKPKPKPKPNPTLDGDAMTLDSDSDSDNNVSVNVSSTDLVNDSLDGIPMLDSSDEEMIDAPPPPPPAPPSQSPPSAPTQKDPNAVKAEDDGGKQVSAIRVPTSTGRQRPRAVDMFADEEED